MVVALRLAVVVGALGTFLAWQAGLAWLWPWLALATCAGFTAAAFFGGDTTAGSRKLRRPVTGTLRAVEAGVTDNHGHAAWMSMKEAMRLFPGGTPAYGGVVVGEAYRVCEDQVAEIAFAPRDERSWGKGGTAALLTFPRRALIGSNPESIGRLCLCSRRGARHCRVAGLPVRRGVRCLPGL